MRSIACVALTIAAILSVAEASAGDKECMSAADEGQRVRDQGRLSEARALFQKCADPSCPAPIPSYCAEWLADVGRKMPSFVFRAVDERDHDLANATVTLDDQPIALDGRAVDVDPGKHRLRVESPGRRPFEAEIVAAQGEKDRVFVAKLVEDRPAPAPAPAPSEPVRAERRRVPVVSWIGWGVGAAGLLSFAAFGIKARSDFDDFQSSCGNRCTSADRDVVASSVTIADVSLVIGLVAAGVGTAFYLLQPSAAPAARASLRP